MSRSSFILPAGKALPGIELAILDANGKRLRRAKSARSPPVPAPTWSATGICRRPPPKRSAARGRIAGFKTPKTVDFIDALPRNASGRILAPPSARLPTGWARTARRIERAFFEGTEIGREMPVFVSMSTASITVIASGAKQSLVWQELDCLVADAPRNDELCLPSFHDVQHHLPPNFAGRFSRKAVTPSLKSSVAPAIRCDSNSRLSWSSNELSGLSQ